MLNTKDICVLKYFKIILYIYRNIALVYLNLWLRLSLVGTYSGIIQLFITTTRLYIERFALGTLL